MQFRDVQFILQPLPDDDGQVLGSRNLVREFGHLFVQMPMVECVDDFAVQDFFQVLEVDHEASVGIHIAFHRDFQRVVVAVAIEIGALAKDALILFFAEVGIVIVMRRREFALAR